MYLIPKRISRQTGVYTNCDSNFFTFYVVMGRMYSDLFHLQAGTVASHEVLGHTFVVVPLQVRLSGGMRLHWVHLKLLQKAGRYAF